MASINAALELDTKKFQDGLRQAGQATDNFTNKVKRSSQDAGRSFDQVSSRIGAVKTALAAIATGAGISSIANVTARFEDLRTSLGTVFGGANAGAQAFKAIQDLSTQTQFGVEELSKTFIKLGAAGIQPTQQLLKSFTDAAAVTTDQIGSLEAITDLFSRTTAGGLGLEDLNRLADRGLPVFDILKEKLGLGRLELTNLGQSAKGAQVILDALGKGIEERFGGATEARLKNLSTQMSNFGIAVTNALNTIGQGAGFGALIEDATNVITSNNSLAESFGQTLGSAVNGLRSLLQVLAENFDTLKAVMGGIIAVKVAGYIRGIALAVRVLTVAIAANPLGALATAAVALIGYLSVENGLGRTMAQLYAVVDKLGGMFSKLGVYLKDKFGQVINWIADKFASMIQVFIDGYNKVAKWTGLFDEIKMTGEELTSSMKDLAGDGFVYVASKADELATAIKNAVPESVKSSMSDLHETVKKAGQEYDKQAEAAKKAGQEIKKTSDIAAGSVTAGGVTVNPTAIPQLPERKSQVTEINKEVEALKRKFEEEKKPLDQLIKEANQRNALIGLSERARAVAEANNQFEKQRETILNSINKQIAELNAKTLNASKEVKGVYQDQVNELQKQKTAILAASNALGVLAGKAVDLKNQYADANAAISRGRALLAEEADIKARIAGITASGTGKAQLENESRLRSAVNAELDKQLERGNKIKVGSAEYNAILAKQREQLEGVFNANVALAGAEEARLRKQFELTTQNQKATELLRLEFEKKGLTATADEKIILGLEQQKTAMVEAEIQARKLRNAYDPSQFADIKEAVDASFNPIIEKTKENQLVAREWATGWKQAFAEYVDNASNAANSAKSAFQTVTTNLENAIVNFVKTGKFSFKDFANSVIADLARIAAKQAIIGIAKLAFGGFFADGGNPPVGMPSIVGEKGPEIFVPRTAGTIIPNDQAFGGGTALGGGAQYVTYNINATDAMSFKQQLARDPGFVHAVVEQGRRATPQRITR